MPARDGIIRPKIPGAAPCPLANTTAAEARCAEQPLINASLGLRAALLLKSKSYILSSRDEGEQALQRNGRQ